MTPEEIIDMARQAGLWETRHSVEMAIGGVSELEDFAKLVAKKEREECALACNKAVGSPSMYYTHDEAAFAHGIKNLCQKLIRQRNKQ